MEAHGHFSTRSRASSQIGALIASIFILLAAGASADPTGSGMVLNDAMCMQEAAGFDLNCTANDVRVSGIADVSGDGIIDEDDISFEQTCDATADNPKVSCEANANICQQNGADAPQLCGDKCAFPGDTTRFSATFIFELSAQERWDVGAYFETMPDELGDGALTGTCSIITLPEDESGFTRPDGTTGNFVDLDTACKGGGCPEPEDLCGDINDDNNPVFYDMKGALAQAQTIEATCVDSDGNGELDLPSCTSWRQSGANEVCLSAVDAFPGAPSKCNCDPGFGIPVLVPAATITVVKTAVPTTIAEPGGDIQFTVDVTNNSLFADVDLYSLDDDIFGDITGITNTNCTTDESTDPDSTIGPGETYSCTFTAPVTGTAVQTHTNVVTAIGIDENLNMISDFDDADVMITDQPSNMSVTKTATPTSVNEPGGDVKFDVVVKNLSAVDVLTLNSLSDDIFGDITSTAGAILSTDCTVSQVIEPGANYSCSFTATVSGNPGDTHTNTVTGVALDDDIGLAGSCTDRDGVARDCPNELDASDKATVDIAGVASSCHLTKTATVSSVSEPGADVTYNVSIQNTSAADSINLTILTDDKFGDITPCAAPGWLNPGQTYNCAFTEFVGGLGNTQHTNMLQSSGLDDDGGVVACSDSETVAINDVPPAASLTKTATQGDITYSVVVSNDSAVEELYLTSLMDDQFGDITIQGEVIVSTTCVVPQTIDVGGNYTCQFVATVSTSPHTNVLTGVVSDDENKSVTPAPSDSETVEVPSLD